MPFHFVSYVLLWSRVFHSPFNELCSKDIFRIAIQYRIRPSIVTVLVHKREQGFHYNYFIRAQTATSYHLIPQSVTAGETWTNTFVILSVE